MIVVKNEAKKATEDKTVANNPVEVVKKVNLPVGANNTGTAVNTAVPKQVLLPSVADTMSENTKQTIKTLTNSPQADLSGSLYSKPELGQEGFFAIEQVKQAEYEATTPRTALESAGELVSQEETKLNETVSFLEAAVVAFYEDPTEEKYAEVERLWQVYDSVYKSYSDAYNQYTIAYNAYKPYEENLNKAISLYDTVMSSHQKQLDEWYRMVYETDEAVEDIDSKIQALEQTQAEFTDATLWYQAYVQNGGDPDAPFIQSDPRMVTYKTLTSKYGNVSAVDSELEKVKQAKWKLENMKKYDLLHENSDFANKSAVTVDSPTAKLGLLVGDNFIGFGDPVYDYINDLGGQRTQPQKKIDSGNAGLQKYNTMTPDEIAKYNYLYNTEGKNSANAYLKYLEADLDKRNQEKLKEEYTKLAQEKPGLATAVSIPANMLSGLGYLDIAGQRAIKGIQEAITGEYAGPVNYNRGLTNFATATQTMRNTVAKTIEDSGKWGKVGSFAYHTAMSMADFLLAAAASGGSSAISLGIMGTGAAAQGTLSAKERGLTDNQAFALGTIQGLAEILTEKISIDALLDATGMGRSMLGYVLQNVLAEGAEEGASTLINTMADVLISKDQSQWMMSIEDYKQQGMSEKEAFWRAAGDQAIALGLDMLGGMISGGFMGGGSAIIGDVKARGLGKDLGKLNLTDADMQAFIQEGLAAPADSRARYLAQQLQEKIEKGGKLSNTDLGRLYQANIAQQPEASRTPDVAGMDAQSQIVANWSRGQGEPNSPVQAAAKPVENVSLPSLPVGTAEQQQTANRLADLTGRNVILYEGDPEENGWYDGRDIHVNVNGADPFVQTFSHELTHSVEMADVYKDLSQLVLAKIQSGGMNLEQLRQEKIAQYARHGTELRGDKVDREIVADYVARNLLNNEQAITDIVRTKPSVGRRILNWINSLLAKLGNANAQERAFLMQARSLYANALNQTQGSFTGQPVQYGQQVQTGADGELDGKSTQELLDWLRQAYNRGDITEEQFDAMLDDIMQEEDLQNEADVKYSYAGGNALTADESMLQQAKELLDSGMEMEEVRQQTGWFIGKDGKWRFELDDSGMILTDNISNYMRLGDLLQHDKLYEAYPDMRYMQVTVEDLPAGVYGEYNRQFDSIRISRNMINDPEGIKDSLVHELQHAIQNREGFTNGSTVESWERKIRNGFDSRRPADIRKALETEQKLEQIRREKPEFYNAMMELRNMEERAYVKEAQLADDYESIYENPEIELQEENPWKDYEARRDVLLEQYGEMEVSDFFDLLHDRQRLAKAGRSGLELYYDTAGEIEARDVAARRQLSEEGRKKTPPRLGGENTVLAANGWMQDLYDPEIASIKEQLNNSADILNAMDEVADVNVPENLRSKEEAANWAIKELKPTGYQVDRQGFGTILFDENDIRYGAKYADTAEEKAVFLVIPRVLKRGVQIGNHGDHKKRGKQTITFAAPVKMNGKRVNVAVVVNLRGNHYNTHRVVLPNGKTFKFGEGKNNDATQELYRGVPRERSLADTTSAASNNTITPGNDAVKQQFSYSDSVSKRDVVSDLKSILARGGDPAELRRYVAQMEQNPSVAERTGNNADQTTREAEQILRSAKQQGISVDEYLQRNWELYDTDGQWNAAAQQAKELEKGNRQYSYSDSGEEAGPEGLSLPEIADDSESDIRRSLTTKAKEYLNRAERQLLKDVAGVMGAHRFADRQYLRDIVREISDEYLRTGTITEERTQELFTQAYRQGLVVDAEFYEQYREIKRHLQTTAVTLSMRDRADVPDYQDFRKRAFGTLRIVNEGGLPVDSAYHELNTMAPELFPESITHPADQLMHMFDVGRSISRSEKNLREYHGTDARTFQKWAKADFDAVIGDVARELQTVKRYADERAAAEAEDARKAPQTVEEALAAYEEMKQARRTYEKAMAKNLLSEHDEMQVGRLLKGELLQEHLDPDVDNVKGITAVFEAKREYEQLADVLAAYKRQLRKNHRDLADGYLETASEWKDKSVGILYSRETMRRNVQDIVKDPEVAKRINREYFESVSAAEAESTRFKNEMRDRVRALNLSTKVARGNAVSEAHAVQLLGEVMDNIRVLENARGRLRQKDGKTLAEWREVVRKLWEESPSLDKGKIEGAVQEFRKIYDQLFQQMNEARVRNGYEPVNYRKGYFPHFQPGDGDGVIAQFGKILGINTQVAALPTTINGLTHTFKPGIQWFGNAQERLGFNTAYDAVEGFDKYIEGVSSVIHQTDNIQKLRALATQVRYRTSDEGIRKQVDAVNENERLTEEEKQVQIAAIYEHGRFALSNFVVELDEYTNLLANKKSKLDRTMEGLLGRRAYTIMKNIESRVGANMIAGNLSSALTNFIPLTQAGAQLDSGSILRGMWSALQSYRQDDGLAGASSFLTNRRGSDPLVKNWAQKASEALGKPMELIDTFVSDSVVRAAYFQNLKRGLSEAEAMHQADVFAAGVIADRSKGAMPTLFESTNPIFKVFTQFQLEVNNQFSEVFKDLPRGFKEKGVAALAMVLLKYFLGAYLFNDLYEYLIGRRPALDPIDMLNNAVGDLTGYELPNLLELGIGMITGEMPSFETEKLGIGEAGTNLATGVLEELPFSSGLGLLGIELDGGRIPVSSAIPDVSALWDAATNTEWSNEKRWKEAQDELNKLAYLLPPFGGNQISKTWKGLEAYFEGGSYNVDAEGNDVLQYPIYKDEPEDAFWNLVRSALMGKSSLPEAQAWVNSGFDSLNAKQTAVYQDLLDADVNDRDAYGVLMDMKSAEKTVDGSKADQQRSVIRESSLSGDGKAILYYGLVASDKDRALMDRLAEIGADSGAVVECLMNIAEADTMIAKQNAIASAALTAEEKLEIYRTKGFSSRDDDIAAFEAAGMDFDTYLGVSEEYARIDKEVEDTSEKALKFAHWVNEQDFSDKQKEVIRDSFGGASYTKQYDEFVDSGISSDDAMELSRDLSELKPVNGNTSVSDVQKWRTCVDFSENTGIQMSALASVMSESQYKKLEIANNLGVNPDLYVTMKEVLPNFDADGNGNYKQDEIKAAIDSLGDNYTIEQKAVLWQLTSTSTSAKNNPYSTSIGQSVLDAKAGRQETDTSFEDAITSQW